MRGPPRQRKHAHAPESTVSTPHHHTASHQFNDRISGCAIVYCVSCVRLTGVCIHGCHLQVEVRRACADSWLVEKKPREATVRRRRRRPPTLLSCSVRVSLREGESAAKGRGEVNMRCHQRRRARMETAAKTTDTIGSSHHQRSCRRDRISRNIFRVIMIKLSYQCYISRLCSSGAK